MKANFLYYIIFLFSIQIVIAQKQYNVLDWKAETSLNTDLLQQMHEQYDQRRIAFNKALDSKKTVIAYQKNVQEKFIQLLGKLPDRTALNAQTTGIIHSDNFSIEKVVYESFPHHHVTSTLYIPDGNQKFPAVLLFCGHEAESKATISYQKTAMLFAQHGFVVMMIDPISQGERYQLTDTKGKPLTRGGTTEHTLLNESSNLFGLSTPADELWDNERGLDYLITRKEVDTTRIGCLGNSGGGMQTIYFAAFDKRIKIAAPCSYVANRERTLELTGAADGCAQMPNEGKEQLELSDYLMAMAPKPLLILAGKYDFIDYTGTQMAFNELKKVYTILEKPDRIKLFTYDDGHGISKPKREAAVRWFSKWMYNDNRFIKEEDLKAFAEKELLVTASGQVNTAYTDEFNLFERNFLLFDQLKDERQKFLNQSKDKIKNKIAGLTKVELNRNAMQSEETGQIQKEHYTIHKLIIRKEKQIPLPVLLISPSVKSEKLIIWLNENGKNKMADSAAFMQSFIDNNYTVILADIRGIGETEDIPSMNDAKYYNKEYRNAMLALHIGKPLIGQRTNDILNLLQFIHQNEAFNQLPIEINASGITSLPVLHAALFDSSVTSISLYSSIHSFKDILEHPLEKNWYSWVIPDVLHYYDIHDLIKLIHAKVSYNN